MNIILIFLQIIVSFVLLNVWLVRYDKETRWRGSISKNMREEFITYGLPIWFMYVVGFLKVSIAILLIVGIWFSILVKPVALLLVFLMLGAIAMHFKVKDTLTKSVPATLMLLAAILIIVLA